MIKEKGNAAIIVLIIVVLIIVGFVVYGSSQNGTPEVNDSSQNNEIAEEASDKIAAENETAPETAPTGENVGSYEEYSPEKIAMAETGDVVLFFHATWCPNCQNLDADIKANMDQIPSDLTILKTDFDTETELKNQYGVSMQHTMIQVDAEGQVISSWAGGSTLASILNRVQ